MRRYEQIYILRPSLSEDEITTIIENTNSIFEDEGGSIIFLNKWGMKKTGLPDQERTPGILCVLRLRSNPFLGIRS